MDKPEALPRGPQDHLLSKHTAMPSSRKGDPLFRNLEGDSRYRAFLRKMRLPV